MPCNTFECILRNPDPCVKEFLELLTVINVSNRRFLNSLSTGRPNTYYRTYSIRERISKSIQKEYEIWVLDAESYGYVVQFRPYQDTKKGKQVASSTKWGLGLKIVLRLTQYLTPTFNFDSFMDNSFTSFCLLTHLGVSNI